MAFPVTINGRTYTLADFEGQNYVVGLPDLMEDFATHAALVHIATSTTSMALGTGTRTFTELQKNRPWQPGTPVRIAVSTNPSAQFMDAVVHAYNPVTGVTTVNVLGFVGTGTFNNWTINTGGGGYAIAGTVGIAQGGTGASTQSGARTALGLGTAATLDWGTAAGNLIRVTGDGKLPTIDGSNLTGLQATAVAGINFADYNKKLGEVNVARVNVGNTLGVAGRAAQLEVNSLNVGVAAIAFRRENSDGTLAFGSHFGLDDENWFSTRGYSAGINGYQGIKLGNAKLAGYLQFSIDGTGPVIRRVDGTGQQFGSLDVLGSVGGYAGIRFVDAGRVLMVHPTYQGIYDINSATWYWRFDNGVFTIGTIPTARITGLDNFINQQQALMAVYPSGRSGGGYPEMVTVFNLISGRVRALEIAIGQPPGIASYY